MTSTTTNLLPHGRVSCRTPECQICSRCLCSHRSWSASIPAWPGCSTTWWYRPYRFLCREPLCSALYRAIKEQVEWDSESMSDSNRRKHSLKHHNHRLYECLLSLYILHISKIVRFCTNIPLFHNNKQQQLRLNYLFVHSLESAAGFQSCCSLTGTQNITHVSMRHIRSALIFRWVCIKKKRKRSRRLTVLACLLIGAVAALGG